MDVIARAPDVGSDDTVSLIPPDPLPEALREAVVRVARDFGLNDDWLNTKIGEQWALGLPPSFENDITWQEYGALRVGIAGRRSLIALKLFAAVVRGPESVHYQDLVTLSPSEAELGAAADWVRIQDTSSVFAEQLEQVIRHVRDDTS